MWLNPVETAQKIHEDYVRYLKSIYSLRDSKLREEFYAALSAKDFLTRGPILEGASPFGLGRSIQQLIGDGILHSGFAELCSEALPFDRPLYLHQDRAVKQIVKGGRNTVIATGTGSGKTESFLIPILDHLLRERAAGTLNKPGVRALLLYPMNALVNDQLRRLRHVLRSFKEITFGRYTGETELGQGKAEERFRAQFPDEPLIPNELLSREQMQEKPPHILITNYAMLEYLLLRPEDCVFFDGETGMHWRFIVLDEAHIYNGAEGVEIGMLLRRLKDRVVRSVRGKLRCIATSATLGRGAEDFPAVAEFARAIFDEPFDPGDVIQAERNLQASLEQPWGRAMPSLYDKLIQGIEQGESIEALAREAQQVGVPSQVVREAQSQARRCAEPLPAFLYYLLRGDERLHQLRAGLKEPKSLDDLAQALFSQDSEPIDGLVKLVDLAARARPNPDEAPLLPARYHMFARALEGAFVCLNDAAHAQGDSASGQPRLFLNRQEKCPHCGSAVFELATCFRCGAAYLVGRESQGKLVQPTLGDEDSVGLSYFIFDFQTAIDDEDEAVSAGSEPSDPKDALKPYTLCVACGAVTPGDASSELLCACGSSAHRVKVYKVNKPSNSAALGQCPSCGARNPNGVVFRFLTSRDAPVSVLATSLYQATPSHAEARAQLPGAGRKLLVFADNRQDAAFFAPYVERTYERILWRRLIYLALQDSSEDNPLRLDDLVDRVRKHAENAHVFSIKHSLDERRQTARRWLMQEMIALDHRIGLEGTGLLVIRPVLPAGWTPPEFLTRAPWLLSTNEAQAVLWMLLDSLRRQGVITFPEGIDPTDDAFKPRTRELFVRERNSEVKAGVLSWLPSRQSNRRQDYLCRLAEQSGVTNLTEQAEAARHLLEEAWRYLTDARGALRDHFTKRSDSNLGVIYRLDYRMWEWLPEVEAKTLYRCTRCQAVSPVSVRRVCPTPGCSGELKPFTHDHEGNHYRRLYQTLEPIPLEAQEHTAQWQPKEAGEIQDKFARGEVNLLSCSTTFELGVDLGSLQTVLMRNVPPTAANYVQRAGRAGRRAGAAAFVLTFAQRRSHDFTYFSHPDRLVAGKIRPPVVNVENEKIVRRHIHSVLLAAFFRWAKDNHGRTFKSIRDFFEEGSPTGVELLQAYAAQRPRDVTEALERIVPTTLKDAFGLGEWKWLPQLTNDQRDGILDLAQQEVEENLQTYQRLEQEASSGRRYDEAKRYSGIINTVRGRQLLGFLGSRNVLPKYGFPSEVVELRVSHVASPAAKRIELQRDLRIAIAEYAPGAEVVAAKQIWRSAGIYRLPGRELQRKAYAVCPECGRYHSAPERLESPTCSVCGSSHKPPRRAGTFLVPEFGFIACKDVRGTTDERPERFYATRPYFAEYTQAPEELSPLAGGPAGVLARYSRYGKLAVINSGIAGRGFKLCMECDWAEPIDPGARQRSAKHENPRTGKECRGRVNSTGLHLGHEFITDVLELRFQGAFGLGSDSWELWLSVLYALLEGASEALGIPREDINGALYPYQRGSSPALVLFDDVPGGAALVQRIRRDTKSVFEAALERVSTCECGEETSCYQCLRNYYNQFCHNQLRRGLARDLLRAVLQRS